MPKQAEERRGADDDARVEEQRERYQELLQELRVLVPGVQVLLAFLLTVPFAARFTELDRTGRIAFGVSLVAAAASALVFMAPTSYHRLAERADRDKRIRAAVRMAVGGMAILALSIVSGIFVVVRFIFNTTTGAAVAAGLGVLIVAFWYAVPLVRRVQQRSGEG